MPLVEAGVILLSYLLGCFPSGYLAGRWWRGVDVRTVGDGNMGAENVWREVGRLPGTLVLIADVGKGALTASLPLWLGIPEGVRYLAGTAAVVGHDWPAFLGFRGGKGVATTLGFFLSLMPLAGAISLSVIAIILVAKRNMNLSLGLGFGSYALTAWWTGQSLLFVAFVATLPMLAGFKHLTMVPPSAKEHRRGPA